MDDLQKQYEFQKAQDDFERESVLNMVPTKNEMPVVIMKHIKADAHRGDSTMLHAFRRAVTDKKK